MPATAQAQNAVPKIFASLTLVHRNLFSSVMKANLTYVTRRTRRSFVTIGRDLGTIFMKRTPAFQRFFQNKTTPCAMKVCGSPANFRRTGESNC